MEISKEGIIVAEGTTTVAQSASLVKGTQPPPTEETLEDEEDTHILTGDKYQ